MASLACLEETWVVFTPKIYEHFEPICDTFSGIADQSFGKKINSAELQILSVSFCYSVSKTEGTDS